MKSRITNSPIDNHLPKESQSNQQLNDRIIFRIFENRKIFILWNTKITSWRRRQRKAATAM